MKVKQIILVLIPINILLVYFVYNSINSEVEFQAAAKVRISENIQKLKDIRAIQLAYKSKYQIFDKSIAPQVYNIIKFQTLEFL